MIGCDSRLPVKQRIRLYSSSLIRYSLRRSGVTTDFFAVEFHEIKSAEGRGVLILPAAFDADIVALDVVGQARPFRRR